MVGLTDFRSHSKSGPFATKPLFDHLKSRLVRWFRSALYNFSHQIGFRSRISTMSMVEERAKLVVEERANLVGEERANLVVEEELESDNAETKFVTSVPPREFSNLDPDMNERIR